MRTRPCWASMPSIETAASSDMPSRRPISSGLVPPISLRQATTASSISLHHSFICYVPLRARLAPAVTAAGSTHQAMVGADLSVPTTDLSASNCLPSGDLVPGRVGNLRGLDLRSSFNHSRHGLQHFWIRSAVIRFRVLLLLPQTDSDRFPSFRGDEGDLVLEALLFPKEGNDFPLNQLGKLRGAIGLQLHANGTSKHVDPLGGLRGVLYR